MDSSPVHLPLPKTFSPSSKEVRPSRKIKVQTSEDMFRMWGSTNLLSLVLVSKLCRTAHIFSNHKLLLSLSISHVLSKIGKVAKQYTAVNVNSGKKQGYCHCTVGLTECQTSHDQTPIRPQGTQLCGEAGNFHHLSHAPWESWAA